MVTELKPCPFCGNDEPVLDRIALSRMSAVFCNACEISGERMSTPEAAVAAWNTRAETPAPLSHTGVNHG